VDTHRFDQLDGKDLSHFRNMYALPFEHIAFSVGRIVYEKGLQVLVRAMPIILAQHPPAKVVIAGKGPELESLRSLAWQLGVGEKVLLTGFIADEDRDRLFKIADCAVFPSLYEPFGIVALEAMAAKCPVVVSEVGGLKDVVQHGKTGITVYPDDPESLAWGIVHTLQHPEWAAARIKRAYRAVREHYNWDRIAEMTTEVYRQVIAERVLTDW
jgi:glycosyltransferase involved in cell wall biosynthesis